MDKFEQYNLKVVECCEVLESIALEISNEEFKNKCIKHINNVNLLMLLSLKADADEKVN